MEDEIENNSIELRPSTLGLDVNTVRNAFSTIKKVLDTLLNAESEINSASNIKFNKLNPDVLADVVASINVLCIKIGSENNSLLRDAMEIARREGKNVDFVKCVLPESYIDLMMYINSNNADTSSTNSFTQTPDFDYSIFQDMTEDEFWSYFERITGDYGIRQGCLRFEYIMGEYSIPFYEIPHRYLNEDGTYSMPDNIYSSAVGNLVYYDISEEYRYLQDYLINKYGFSKESSLQVMSIVDSLGACTHSSTCNQIVYSYRSDPYRFERCWGFPLYRMDEKGNLVVNGEQLLLDAYVNINIDEVEGSRRPNNVPDGMLFDKNENGGLEIDNRYFEWLNRYRFAEQDNKYNKYNLTNGFSIGNVGNTFATLFSGDYYFGEQFDTIYQDPNTGAYVSTSEFTSPTRELLLDHKAGKQSYLDPTSYYQYMGMYYYVKDRDPYASVTEPWERNVSIIDSSGNVIKEALTDENLSGTLLDIGIGGEVLHTRIGPFPIVQKMDDGGHQILVTGVKDDNNLYISTWGKKGEAPIQVNLDNATYFNVNRFSIDINSNHVELEEDVASIMMNESVSYDEAYNQALEAKRESNKGEDRFVIDMAGYAYNWCKENGITYEYDANGHVTFRNSDNRVVNPIAEGNYRSEVAYAFKEWGDSYSYDRLIREGKVDEAKEMLAKMMQDNQ